MISVVMPSFNSGAYIADAIQSVLANDHAGLELLVQDGGSTDETLAILEHFTDERVRIVSEPDDGQTDGLNKAIARARGEWILWLNADDLLSRNALTLVQPAIDSGRFDVVFGDYQYIDHNGTLLKTYYVSPLSRKRLLARGCYIFSGALFVRRDVFRKVGMFDPTFEYSMDYEFLVRAAPRISSYHCRAILASLRFQPTSKTSMHGWRQFWENFEVRRRYGGFSRGSWPRPLLGQLEMALYLASRPVWHSSLWRRLRPTKRV
jgi:glycosyltransferase involved in cell wall biosynthesis